MDDRPMLVAEAAFEQGIELDYDHCEALASELGDRVYDQPLLLGIIRDHYAFAA